MYQYILVFILYFIQLVDNNAINFSGQYEKKPCPPKTKKRKSQVPKNSKMWHPPPPIPDPIPTNQT